MRHRKGKKGIRRRKVGVKTQTTTSGHEDNRGDRVKVKVAK